MSTPEVKGSTPGSETNNTPVNTTNPEVKAATVEQQSSWDELKGKLKTRFPGLTDADLQYDESSKEEMLEKIRTKVDKTTEEFAAIVAAL